MILMLKAKQMFLCFYDNTIHDSLIVAVILASSSKFFSAKCVPIFFKILGMKLNQGDFSFETVIIHL